jgi:hypothetical protein
MNKALAFLSVASICAVGAVGTGCESDEGGTGGTGGTIGPLTWTASDMVVGEDTCDFFAPEEPLVFEMTIEGSTVTMEVVIPEPQFGEPLQASTDSYDPTANEVTLEGEALNDQFPPCVAQLNEAFELTLDDPDLSLDENTTVQVTWDHDELDVSDTVGDCVGEWPVPLPCAGEATLTLTQD